MLGRLIILMAIGVGVYLLLRWFARTPPQKVARATRQGLIYGGIGLLVVLAATGRLHWVFVALGALVPLVQRGFLLMRALPLVQQVLRAAGISIPGVAGAGGANAGGRVSTISTRFLTMTLEHASGEMDGEIIEGPHQGQHLSDLPLETLVELVAEYRRQDQQSAAVLEAYLDRHHGQEWRQGTGHEERSGDNGGAMDGGGRMSHDEALAILGLQAGADEKAVREAHRRLMQKLHPDRGGSDWLASRINLAKDTLLEN